jgi:hypothetical protein
VLPNRRNAVKFILTRGEADSILNGTAEFAQQLMYDMHLSGNVESWSIHPCRTKYYSEYLGEEDWRDNWQIVWKMQILSQDIIRLPELEESYFETNAQDESWTMEANFNDNSEVSCLIISDFENELVLGNVQDSVQTILYGGLSSDFTYPNPTFEHFRIAGDYIQLQINLGEFPGEFFAEGADYAEQVINLCLQMGGTVHFADRE